MGEEEGVGVGEEEGVGVGEEEGAWVGGDGRRIFQRGDSELLGQKG